MTLTLSTGDVARLEAALTTLVSPLSYPTIQAWGAAAMRDVRAALGADQAFFALPAAGGVEVHGDGPFTAEAARAYEQYFWRLDYGVVERRKAMGLEAYNLDMLYSRAELLRHENYNDWMIPNRLLDVLGLGIEVGGGFPAALHVYHDSETRHPFGERGLTLMRLLLPAFKAGVHTCLTLARHRAVLGRLVDELEEGLAVYDRAGRLLHESRSLGRLLAGEPEAARLRAECARLARSVIALAERPDAASHPADLGAPLVSELGTAGARYRLRCSAAGGALMEPGAAAVVLVERVTPRPLTPEQLRERYGLTPREVEVARLLAEGRSNAEVARALAISPHTAECHTERVLRKLGVHARAQVGPTLRGGQ